MFILQVTFAVNDSQVTMSSRIEEGECRRPRRHTLKSTGHPGSYLQSPWAHPDHKTGVRYRSAMGWKIPNWRTG